MNSQTQQLDSSTIKPELNYTNDIRPLEIKKKKKKKKAKKGCYI